MLVNRYKILKETLSGIFKCAICLQGFDIKIFWTLINEMHK